MYQHLQCPILKILKYLDQDCSGPLSWSPRQIRPNMVTEHAKSCADHCKGAHLDSISIDQIITNALLRWRCISRRPLSIVCTYIRVTERYPQSTRHFNHFSHVTTSFGYWLERQSANVSALTFHLHREDSNSATTEHREQPSRLIDRHRTNLLVLEGGNRSLMKHSTIQIFKKDL